ncbi:MAG: PLDc N-terminal domain-containing protein [Bacteroidia bacterium]
MRTPSGKKYYHDSYLFSDERFDFQNMIIEKFGSCGQGSKLSFYSSGMPIIIGLVVGILLFNAIILLWFVAFFNLLNSEFKENHNKWIWFISFIFLPLITPLYYMLISDKQKRDWTPK